MSMLQFVELHFLFFARLQSMFEPKNSKCEFKAVLVRTNRNEANQNTNFLIWKTKKKKQKNRKKENKCQWATVGLSCLILFINSIVLNGSSFSRCRVRPLCESRIHAQSTPAVESMRITVYRLEKCAAPEKCRENFILALNYYIYVY